MQMKKPLLVIVGPTGVGKTALAVELALRLQGEVVTADSMQVYKGMDIGTAKPSPDEMQGVRHHLIDVVTPDTPFNVAMYRDLAHEVIAQIHSRGNLPIVSGGTGLYVRAILDEFLFPDQGANTAVRERLARTAEEKGREYLHNKLAEIDPDTAARLHPNDVRRVIRALEVFETTGRTMSEQIAEAQAAEPRYRDIRIGLTRPREELYRRIDQRVDEQLKQGLIDEVRQLRASYDLEKTALQALGYKEIITYLDGEATLEEAVLRLKQQTRHYAKRQYTWFKRDPSIRWFDLSGYQDPIEAAESICEWIVEALPDLQLTSRLR